MTAQDMFDRADRRRELAAKAVLDWLEGGGAMVLPDAGVANLRTHILSALSQYEQYLRGEAP